ncbi:MAG TPA: hypothetical protein VIK95_07420 [Egibacteraceae bacterium]
MSADTQPVNSSTEYPPPAPQLAQLEYLVGTWDGKGTFIGNPAEPPYGIEVELIVTRHLRGHFCKIEWREKETAENPHPTIADWVFGWDHVAGRFVADYIDNKGNRVRQFGDGWDGDEFAVEGPMSLYEGKELPLRDTFVRTGPDTCREFGAVYKDGDWRLAGEADFVRRR